MEIFNVLSLTAKVNACNMLLFGDISSLLISVQDLNARILFRQGGRLEMR